MSISYPYFGVAREKRLDYGAVLRVVEMFETEPKGWPQYAPEHVRAQLATISPENLQVIHAVYRMERNRQAAIRALAP